MNYKIIISIIAGCFFVLIFLFVIWASSNAVLENIACKFKNTEYKLQPTNELKIMSWNIGYASGLTNNTSRKLSFDNYTQNLSVIKTAIKSEKPDIVTLQEVDYGSNRSYKIDESNFIYDGIFENTIDCANWNLNYIPFPYWPISSHFGRMFSGQSTFSKLQIEKHEKFIFEKPKANGKIYNLFYIDRMALITKINIGFSNRPLILVNVHLEAFDVQTRMNQAKQLISDLEKYKNFPIIIIGDFNMLPTNASRKNNFQDEPEADFTNDQTYEILKSKFKTIYQEKDDFLTFPSNGPTRQLDHVFYNEYIEPSGFRVLDQVGGESAPSDHLPIVFKFRIGL